MSAQMSRDAIFGFEVMTWWTEHELPRFDVRPALPGITVPALIVTGRHDRITPPSQAETMAALLPNARLEIFEDSGHMTICEEQPRFLALVREFLA